MPIYETAGYGKNIVKELTELLPNTCFSLSSTGEVKIEAKATLSAATKAQIEAIIGKEVSKID